MADSRPKDAPKDDDNNDQGGKPNDPTPTSDPEPPPTDPGDVDNPGRKP